MRNIARKQLSIRFHTLKPQQPVLDLKQHLIIVVNVFECMRVSCVIICLL